MAIEWLPRLKYLDYELITQDDRDKAKIKHSESENVDKHDRDADQENALNSQIPQDLLDANLGGTQRLFEKIIEGKEGKEEGKRLRVHIEKFQELFNLILEPLKDEVINKFQDSVKKIHKEKQRNIYWCTKLLRDSELEAEKKSIKLIQEFVSFKKHKLKELDAEEEKSHILDDYYDLLISEITNLEEKLMEIEMLLQDALQVANGQFKDKLKEINLRISE
jgi:hypothetical protein